MPNVSKIAKVPTIKQIEEAKDFVSSIKEVPSAAAISEAKKILEKSRELEKAKKLLETANVMSNFEMWTKSLRALNEGKDLSYYYKMKLAEQGLIEFVTHKVPHMRNRPELRPILTSEGKDFFKRWSKDYPGYLKEIRRTSSKQRELNQAAA